MAREIYDFAKNRTWTVDEDVAPSPAFKSDVDAEFQRRIALPFEWGGRFWQIDDLSRQRLQEAALVSVEMDWFDVDNEPHPMTPKDLELLSRAAFGQASHLRVMARALKDMEPIPHDYQNDSYWTKGQ